jgi:hypothetical protein
MQYTKKFRWYLNENEGWQQVIQMQRNEIPQLEKILTTIIYDEHTAKDKMELGKLHFGQQLEMQSKEMALLNQELDVQQKRLANDCDTDIENDIDAFCTQDILRQRIRDIEKTYLELKCNFMTYLSTVL